MGIKDLYSFITEKFPDISEAIPVSSFHSYRIAVDVYGLGYILMGAIRARYIWSRDVISHPIEVSELETPWLKAFFDYILPWLKHGITPVFVFDGPHKHIKTQKLESDRAEKEAKKLELEAIMQSSKSNAWKTDSEMLDRARKLLVSLNHIPSVQIETLKNILQSMKFPVIQAPGDGETICSALCKAGYVTAVFSADGDNLAHGCPILIRDKANSLQRVVAGMIMEEDAFSIIRISRVLDIMGISQAQFTDFCIMCGCDYNQRIFNVGPVKSLKYIKDYGCIERVPLDTRVLNHHICRQEFNTVIDLHSLDIDSPGALDVKGWDSISSECMASYNLETLISDYRTYIQRLPTPRNFKHPSSIVKFVFEEYDQLVGIVPLPKQEKKSKYSKKKKGKKETPTPVLFNVPVTGPSANGWNLGPPVFYPPSSSSSSYTTYPPSSSFSSSYPQQAYPSPSSSYPQQAYPSPSSSYPQQTYLPSQQQTYLPSQQQTYLPSQQQTYSQQQQHHSGSQFVMEDNEPTIPIQSNIGPSNSIIVPSTPQMLSLSFPLYDYTQSAQTPYANTQSHFHQF